MGLGVIANVWDLVAIPEFALGEVYYPEWRYCCEVAGCAINAELRDWDWDGTAWSHIFAAFLRGEKGIYSG